MQRRSVAALLCCLGASTPSLADIYTFVDQKGVLHISNIPNDPRFRLTMATPSYVAPSPAPSRSDTRTAVVPATDQFPPGISYGDRQPARVISEARRRQYAADIVAVAQAYRLEPALLHAVISAESAYDPLAVSRAGAMGLMQLMPATAERFGVSNAFDPLANLHGGARYLRQLLDQFQQLSLALAAYNAGENRVVNSGYTIPPIPETQTYVSRVLDYYDRYRGQY